MGKSTILTTYFSKEHRIATVGVEFAQKTLEIGKDSYRVQLWDTAGQEQYMSITPIYFRNVNICLLVFDLTNKHSFKSLDGWIQEMEKATKHRVLTILVANKQDLPNMAIDQDKIAQFCVEHKLAVFYISALDEMSVNELLTHVITQHANFEENEASEAVIRREMEKPLEQKVEILPHV